MQPRSPAFHVTNFIIHISFSASLILSNNHDKITMKTVSTLSGTPVLEQMPVTLQYVHSLFSLTTSLIQVNKDNYNITE